jgi:ABC-2 type transport system permease protein
MLRPVTIADETEKPAGYGRTERGPSALDGQRMLSDPELVERSRRPGPIQRLRNIWEYRELLRNLVRLQLKVKYKNSVLGFVWSLLNPLLYLVIFTFVFTVVQPAGINNFAVFLLSGLLAWTLFSTSLGEGTNAIVHNSSLVNRVWFPREILPLAGIGAALVHFFLQLIVLVGAMIVFQRSPAWTYLPVLFLALAVLLLLATGMALILSAVNVYLRDTGHLLELVLLAWFWFSAIVYDFEGVRGRFGENGWNANILLLNPMISVITAFQRVIYNPGQKQKDFIEKPDGSLRSVLPDVSIFWYLKNLAIVGSFSLVLLFIGLHVFGRLEDNFAEEI